MQSGTRRRHCLARTHCRIGEAENPGPPDKRRPYPMCGAQNQLQTRRSTCSMCETLSVTVWKCSTCPDGFRKQGTLFCDDCMEHAAQVKGDEAAATEKDAGASGSTEGAEKHRFQVTENDLRRCSCCAEPFVQRRARRQDHGHEFPGSGCNSFFVSSQTNRSWIHTCTVCQRHFCMECHARHWQSTCNEEVPDRLRYHPLLHFFHLCLRQTRVTSTCFCCTQRSTRSLSYRQSNVTREDWTAGVQEFDCKPLTAMQAAKANAAAPTQRLWSKMALLIPHLLLRVAPGHKQQEQGLGSIRGEIRKSLALTETQNLEQLLNGAIEDQEK